MKDGIINVILTLMSKKNILILRRKLDLLSSLSGKRCLGCNRFLYDVSFDNSFCPTCIKEKPAAWVKYDLERQKREKEIEALEEIKTPKSLRFVTSLDPKFQLKIKKGIDKEFDKELDKIEKNKI